MARIRVVTDSACDLSAEMAAEHGVTVVPLSIRFGAEEFVDGKDLTTEEFWARCKASAVLPETAAPSPGAFQEAFLAAADDGTTGCCASTCRPGCRRPTSRRWRRPRRWPTAIEVRDGRQPVDDDGTRPHGARRRRAGRHGADLDTLEARATELDPPDPVFGVVDNLEHLAKGGRIGGARALLGSMLSIKPVVTLVDGEVARSPSSAPRPGRSSTWPTRPATVPR